MTEDQKRMYDKHIEHGDDMTYENEGDRDMSPMVRISLKEYDKLKPKMRKATTFVPVGRCHLTTLQ